MGAASAKRARAAGLLIPILIALAGSAEAQHSGGADGMTPADPVRADTLPLSWPDEKEFRHGRTIEHVRDSAAATVTTQVVLERGKYLLWMQRPRVTVASIRPEALPAGTWPEEVLIEFRTQSPQYAATTVLTLTTGDSLRLEARASASRIDPRTFVTDHTLTFRLPLAEFLAFAQARTGRLEVGGVGVRLREEHLEAIRDFAVQVQDGGRAGIPR
jgi:hypothetical protein